MIIQLQVNALYVISIHSYCFFLTKTIISISGGFSNNILQELLIPELLEDDLLDYGNHTHEHKLLLHEILKLVYGLMVPLQVKITDSILRNQLS